MVESMKALLWPLVMLSLMIIVGGFVMCQLVLDFIRDDAEDTATRRWAYDHYGTSARAVRTMVEATLSGLWPNYAVVLVDNINAMFAVFWFVYIAVVAFAMLQVISALIIKDVFEKSEGSKESRAYSEFMKKEAHQSKQQCSVMLRSMEGIQRSLDELVMTLLPMLGGHQWAQGSLSIPGKENTSTSMDSPMLGGHQWAQGSLSTPGKENTSTSMDSAISTDVPSATGASAAASTIAEGSGIAVSLGPKFARMDVDSAQSAFPKAQKLDSAEPSPGIEQPHQSDSTSLQPSPGIEQPHHSDSRSLRLTAML